MFQNCNGKDLELPDAAPVTADPVVRADRAYQIAAAYFYPAFITVADRDANERERQTMLTPSAVRDLSWETIEWIRARRTIPTRPRRSRRSS